MITNRGGITVRAVLACILLLAPWVANAQGGGAELQTGSSALTTRVAPGESLPLAVRLSNFGSNARVDVSIRYDIFNAQESLILSETETVAVETSASYIKQLPLPLTTVPGVYTARTSITYDGQRVPATASLSFSVERKVYGIFMSDLKIDIAILGAVAVFCVLLGLLVRRHRREYMLTPHDYSDIPKETRIYYEIVGDAIGQMHYHAGDAALDIAAGIPGLTIDKSTGRVLAITRDPSEVIASVIAQYEQSFGKKLSLAFTKKREGHAIVK